MDTLIKTDIPFKLKHLTARKAAESGVFKNIKNYSDLVKNIKKFDKTFPTEVGKAFEVFAEFFFRRYTTGANPKLGITWVGDTSNDPYNVGFDFRYKDLAGVSGYIQVKFRSNQMDKFTREQMGTFTSRAEEDGVDPDHRILFTNLTHLPTDSVYHFSYSNGNPKNICRSPFDRTYQESYINADPTFWSELEVAVAQSSQKPAFKTENTLRDHQRRMLTEITTNITSNPLTSRGRVICCTGGGKTEVAYQVVKSQLPASSLAVVVAPTIDLLRQHHEYFEQFGMFHDDNNPIKVIHFRTGSEARSDDYIDYAQTTHELNLAERTIIFVTYASEERMFDLLAKQNRVADICIWDEFQHAIKQDEKQKTHLLNLPVKHNVFFSASQKRGRKVSALDESLFGPELINVDYKELKSKGILVPNIEIKLIKIKDGSRFQAISEEFEKAAEQENFDIKVATIEAASGIVARNDLVKSQGYSNLLTFSKAVPICKAIVESEAVAKELSTAIVNTVHSGIGSDDRKDIYKKVKTSTDSVLCQYSVVKEGIDITPFNGILISRKMDVIGVQQAIGRVVRAEPIDTKGLVEGLLSLTDSASWKKYTSTVYVILHDDSMVNFKEFMIDLVAKLTGAGLSRDDYQFTELTEERHGVTEGNNADVLVEYPKDIIDAGSLKNYVGKLQIEIVAKEKEETDVVAYEDRLLELSEVM